MDSLRWILLGIGIVAIVVVYLWTRWQSESRAQDYRGHREAPGVPDHAPDPLLDEVNVDAPGLSEVQAELSELEQMLGDERRAAGDSGGAPAALREQGCAGGRGAGAPRGPEQTRVVAVYLVAPRGQPFAGHDIEAALRACGLEFGEMNIYHRYPPGSFRGRPVFSVAGLVEPGTLAPGDMGELRSPGLTLFMQLPGPLEAVKAYDELIATARQLQRRLDGELRDAQRSLLSRQSIEHQREELLEYERRQRLAQVRG